MEIKHLSNGHNSGFHKFWEGRTHSVQMLHVIWWLLFQKDGFQELWTPSHHCLCDRPWCVHLSLPFLLDYLLKWYYSHVLLVNPTLLRSPLFLFNCHSHIIPYPPLPANSILSLTLTTISTSLARPSVSRQMTLSSMHHHHTPHLPLLPPKLLVLSVSIHTLIQVTSMFHILSVSFI